MASDIRQRRPVAATAAPAQQSEEDKSKTVSATAAEPEPNIFLTSILFVLFTAIVGSLLWYKVEPESPFAAWVNEKFPVVDSVLNKQSVPFFGAQAAGVTGQLKLTEEELKAFDGTDPEKPIYLGLNGTIFDVSASPAFYGPGGHYHHFVGKDATRAWVTECWDEPDQFTWRLDKVEVMFIPKWFDEQVMQAANNENDEELKLIPMDMRETMAKKLLERYGTLTDREIKERRKTDKVEAKEQVEAVLKKWVSFFESNEKYKVAGTVIRDESKPAPPKPCKQAMEKRPTKGGKLDALMQGGMNLGNLMGAAGAAAAGGEGAGAQAPPPAGEKKGEMPQWVKDKLAKEAAEKVKSSAGRDEL